MINISVGLNAYRHIMEKGLSISDIGGIVGASGGPKWFSLAGLDRYLTGEAFSGEHHPIITLGSSAGAWRFSCYAQSDKRAALERLIEGYSEINYALNSSSTDISNVSKALLEYVHPDRYLTEMVTNKRVQSAIVVAECLGWIKSLNKKKQIAGLACAAARNLRGRKHLAKSFRRVVFTNRNAPDVQFDDAFGQENIALSIDNYRDALLATGAIPLVLDPVSSVSEAENKVLLDGGIIDYHFDMNTKRNIKLPTEHNLILYPHFYDYAVPGWFDKSMKERKVSAQQYENVVMISPSAEYVANLPYGKIPDRKDFKHLDARSRVKYFKTVIDEGSRLAEQFDRYLHNPELLKKNLRLLKD